MIGNLSHLVTLWLLSMWDGPNFVSHHEHPFFFFFFSFSFSATPWHMEFPGQGLTAEAMLGP